jgi:2-phospho-L-lactate guanylyltransferase
MMRWTAVMPLKLGSERKSRLAGCLSTAERARLMERMGAHVMSRLAAVRAIEHRILLAAANVPALNAQWVPDGGRNLNEELDVLQDRMAGKPLLVIHADLPFIGAEDIVALIQEAERTGAAIAPDRSGSGTNGVAIVRAGMLRFAFGDNSHARHRERLGPGTRSVLRDGLAFDIDTPADLAAARRHDQWRRRYGLSVTMSTASP